MKCIYCLEEKESPCFKGREHVLPESFGRFKNNFILHERVCDKCNHIFGITFETILGRDTIEGGTLRYEIGIKEPDEFKSLGRRSRISYTVQEGQYLGVHVYREYVEKTGQIMLYLCPQVGILTHKGSYEWYLLDNLPKKEDLSLDKYQCTNPRFFRILGCETEHAHRIFAEYGMNHQTEESAVRVFDDSCEQVMCEVKGELEEVDFRARAKIGFNYLAYWHGKEIVLDKIFDPIRNYIRWGKISDIPMRGVITKPFFPDEEMLKGKRAGHIIALHWDEKEQSLVARVSLCNFAQYVIRLAKDESGRYRHIKKGHFFNLQQMSILELDLSKFDLSFR